MQQSCQRLTVQDTESCRPCSVVVVAAALAAAVAGVECGNASGVEVMLAGRFCCINCAQQTNKTNEV